MKGTEALEILNVRCNEVIKDHSIFFYDKDYYDMLKTTIEKELKALEIIDEKGFIVLDHIKHCLTKKEYDLLKEVLGNEEVR